MTAGEIIKARRRAQYLDAPFNGTPAGLVRWLGAVQSQDLALARWSVGQRLADATDTTIDAALAEGSILRTHVLRPTWHFVAREDLSWMVALTGPRVFIRMGPYDRRNGLDADLIRTSTRAMARAIGKAGHLTRAEIADALRRKGVRVETGWLVGHLLLHAELQGVICSGTPRGTKQTYALVDERAGRAALSRDEAVVELARRYFQSHAPATAQDYRWWSGLTAADVAIGVDALGRDFERVTVGKITYIVACQVRLKPDATPVPRVPLSKTTVVTRVPRSHLLQAFDELVVAYGDSRTLVDPKRVIGAERLDGLLTRSVLLGDRLVGRWRRELSRAGVNIAIELGTRIDAAGRRTIEQAAGRFAAFFRSPAAPTVALTRRT